MRIIPLSLCLFCLASLALLQVSCRSTSRGTEVNEGSANSLTLYESRLLNILTQERELDQLASQPNSNRSDVERLFKKIARSYNLLIADNPAKIEARLLYGKLLSRYGDNEGARKVFVAAAQIEPTAAVIHQQLGNYYAESGDPTRALAYYLNAIDFSPNEAIYHFGLGDLIYEYKDRLIEEGSLDRELLDTKMLMAFKQAAEIDSSNPIYQFRYGESFYDVENPDWIEAYRHWSDVYKWLPLTEVQANAIRLHQSRCLLGLKKYDEAIKVARSVNMPGLIQTRIALIDQIRAVMHEEEKQK